MASQAEIDLLVDATRTLPDLERNLARIISVAERNADDIDVDAAVNTRTSLAFMQRDINTLIRRAEAGAPDLDLIALLDQQRTLTGLAGSLDDVITQAQNQAPDIDLTAILNQTRSLRRVRRDLNRLVDDVTPPDIDINANVRVDPSQLRAVRQLDNNLNDMTRRVRSAASSFALFSAAGVGVAGSLGGLAPLLAGVATAAQQIAPAAALGTQAMLTMQLVSGTLKLALVGVEDAITAAFDPEKAEEFEAALAKLAPEAQDFVKELRSMGKELRAVQQRVQGNFFRGFDTALENLARETGPAVSRALDDTSRSLNRMALGAAEAATEMGRNGTLGQALDSAIASLQNLERIPGQATTGFTQLAAASGPAMERVSRAVAREADKIAGDLATAFETGRLEESINQALDAIRQLGRIGGNLLSGLGHIIGGVTSEGEGLFFILEDLSEAFERLTASEEFQSILTELVKTGQELVDNVLPLLGEAFKQLAPVIEELGPPVRDFIKEVGPELIPVLKELGPILVDIAEILREQMPFAIEFSKAALQALTVILNLFHRLLEGVIVPVLRKVAQVLNSDYVKAIAAASRITFEKVTEIVRSFDNFRQRVSDAIALVRDRLGTIVAAAVRMASGVGRAIGDVIGIFTSLPGEIISALGGLASALFSAGQNAVFGLVRGMASLLGRVRQIASEIARTVAEAVTGFLKIQSPSRLFMEIGDNTVQGFIEGIKRSLPELARASAQMAGIASAQSVTAGINVPGFNSALTSPSTQALNVMVQIGNTVIDDHIRVITRSESHFRDLRLAQGVRR